MQIYADPAKRSYYEKLLADARRAAMLIRRGQTWMRESERVEIIDERPIWDVYACFVRITKANGATSCAALPPHYIVDNFMLCPQT